MNITLHYIILYVIALYCIILHYIAVYIYIYIYIYIHTHSFPSPREGGLAPESGLSRLAASAAGGVARPLREGGGDATRRSRTCFAVVYEYHYHYDYYYY